MNITTIIVSAITALIVAAFNYMLNRTKNNAELLDLDIKNFHDKMEVYRSLLADITKKRDDDNIHFESIIADLTGEVSRVKGIVIKIAADVCIKPNCIMRTPLDNDTVTQLLEGKTDTLKAS